MFEECFYAKKQDSLAHRFSSIPRRFWPSLVRYCMKEGEEVDLISLGFGVIERLGVNAEEAELLWELLEKDIPAPWGVVQCLWQCDPAKACKRACELLKEDPESPLTQFFCSRSTPTRYFHDIFGVIARLDEQPLWLAQWLQRILIDEPAYANATFALICQTDQKR